MKHLFAVLICLLPCWSCQTNSKSAVSTDTVFNEAAFVLHGAQGFYRWSVDRVPLVSAHRGGPYPGYPENAIATFEHIAQLTPVIIECDIAMTRDSVLVLMHDATLDRTSNGQGQVADHDWKDLQSLYLKDNEGQLTAHGIPTLKEALQWGKGKVLFTLDVKRGVPFEKVIATVNETKMGPFSTIITYRANDAQKVYQLDSSLMISASIGSVEAYEAHKASGIPDENMIAFVGVSEPAPELYDLLHRKGITCILGVLGNLDRKVATKSDSLYAGFIKRGADILATDRPAEVAGILKTLVPETSNKRQFFNDY